MKILAIDTATEACSAALYIDGETIELFQLAPREHTQLVLKMVKSLLEQAGIRISDLDALAFGRGPGSFTGVRIATGVVQGMAFAADLPVVPISTLASIAQSTFEDKQYTAVLAGIDARMGAMYWGCYLLGDNGLMQLQGEEQVLAPELVKIPDDSEWVGSGSAWESYSEQLARNLGGSIKQAFTDYFPHSGSIVKLAVAEYELGHAVEAHKALPVYLRDDVAKKATPKK